MENVPWAAPLSPCGPVPTGSGSHQGGAARPAARIENREIVIDWNSVLTWIVALVSALLGALVGGWMSKRGSIEATEQNVKLLKDWDREREREQRRKEKFAIVLDLIGETEGNIELTEPTGDYWLTPMDSHVWDIHKGKLVAYFNGEDRARLRGIYTQIAKIDSLLESAHSVSNVRGAVVKYKERLREDLKALLGWLREMVELGMASWIEG